MSEPKHTPGRLYVDGGGNIWNDAGRFVASCGGYGGGYGSGSASSRENVANAERLVLCWNAHDDLLAACEDALAFVPLASTEHANANEQGRENARQCVERLREAIAKGKP